MAGARPLSPCVVHCGPLDRFAGGAAETSRAAQEVKVVSHFYLISCDQKMPPDQ